MTGQMSRRGGRQKTGFWGPVGRSGEPPRKPCRKPPFESLPKPPSESRLKPTRKPCQKHASGSLPKLASDSLPKPPSESVPQPASESLPKPASESVPRPASESVRVPNPASDSAPSRSGNLLPRAALSLQNRGRLDSAGSRIELSKRWRRWRRRRGGGAGRDSGRLYAAANPSGSGLHGGVHAESPALRSRDWRRRPETTGPLATPGSPRRALLSAAQRAMPGSLPQDLRPGDRAAG